MTQFTFIPESSAGSIERLRDQYLADLSFAQEYYVELMLNRARLFVIESAEKPVGYFFLNSDACLLEYYLEPQHFPQIDSVFDRILREFKVEKALCKSFDTALLSCCSQFQKSFRPTGILFREYHKQPAIHSPGTLSIRLALPSDEPTIVAINEEVFDDPSEVMSYIASHQLFIYEKESNLVGFGIFSRIIRGRKDYDVGMLVHPAFRGKGYGQYIIQHLVDFCHENGWNPVAGCDYRNTASRRCLEKSGFVARHRLFEFTF